MKQLFTFSLFLLLSINYSNAQTTHIIVNSAGGNCNTVGGDGGLAVDAEINSSNAVVADSLGNVYFTDRNSIRKVDINTGIVNTIAGISDSSGYSGDGDLAVNALFNNLNGINLHDNKLYISDFFNNRLRVIDLDTDSIYTLIGAGGNGLLSSTDTLAPLNTNIRPSDLDFDANGNIIFMNSDRQVIKYDLNMDKVYMLVEIPLNYFYGITVNRYNGDIYYVHRQDTVCEIKKLSASDYNTPICFAGAGLETFSGDGAAAINAGFKGEWGIALSHDTTTLYIADRDNYRLRAIDMATGIVTTAAGNGSTSTNITNGGSSSSQPLGWSRYIKTSPNGSVYLTTDLGGCRIIEIRPAGTNTTVNSVPNNKSKLQFYPNPNNGRLHFQSDITIERIEFWTITGKLVNVVQPNSRSYSTQLDTPSGAYILHSFDENGKRYINKLIIR